MPLNVYWPIRRAGRVKCEPPRHVVEAELQFMPAAHPTERLVDLPVVVDLLQTPSAVAKPGHPGDVRRGQSRRRATAIRIRNPEFFRDIAVFRARVVDALEHSRVADAKFVVFRRARARGRNRLQPACSG